MANEDVIFTFSGDTADLEASVGKAQSSIAGLGTTTKASSDKMSASMGKASTASKDLGKSTSQAAASTTDLSATTGKAQESVGALGSAIAVVNPQLGAMVQQSSALIGGLKGMTGGAGLLGGTTLVVLGAALASVAAAAYLVYKNFKITKQETEELGGKIDGVSLALEDFEARQDLGSNALKGFRETVRKAALEIAVLNGEMSTLEKKQDEATAALALGIKPELNAAAAAAKTAEAEYRKMADALDTATSALDAMKAAGASAESVQVQGMETAVAASQANLEAAQAQKDAAYGLIESLKQERIEGQKTVAEALARAEEEGNLSKQRSEWRSREAREAADLAKAEADAAAEKKRLEEEQIQRLSDFADALDAIRSMQADATKATLSEEAAIEAAREDTMAALDAQYEAAKELLSGDNEEKLELERAYGAAQLAIVKEFQAQRDALADEALLRDRERRQEDLEDAISAAQIVSDAVGTISDVALDQHRSNLDALREYRAANGENMTAEEKKQLQKRIKAEKKAMRELAVAQKASAILDIAIKTAQGIMAVWAQFAAFPPVAAALSAVVGAAGTASAVGVASQKVEFHRGGVVDAALLPGEAVLNRQATAALGNDGVDRLNSGSGGMAPSVTLQIGRREAREIIRTDVRSGGMVTQEIGRIANTSGNVGLSGLPVLA